MWRKRKKITDPSYAILICSIIFPGNSFSRITPVNSLYLYPTWCAYTHTRKRYGAAPRSSLIARLLILSARSMPPVKIAALSSSCRSSLLTPACALLLFSHHGGRRGIMFSCTCAAVPFHVRALYSLHLRWIFPNLLLFPARPLACALSYFAYYHLYLYLLFSYVLQYTGRWFLSSAALRVCLMLIGICSLRDSGRNWVARVVALLGLGVSTSLIG